MTKGQNAGEHKCYHSVKIYVIIMPPQCILYISLTPKLFIKMIGDKKFHLLIAQKIILIKLKNSIICHDITNQISFTDFLLIVF